MEEDSSLPKKTAIRRFRLKRKTDESGVSGVGYVAEGVRFSDGSTILHWTSETPCTGIYRSPVELEHIHGHGGATEIEWIDPEFEELEESPKTKKKKTVSKKR